MLTQPTSEINFDDPSYSSRLEEISKTAKDYQLSQLKVSREVEEAIAAYKRENPNVGKRLVEDSEHSNITRKVEQIERNFKLRLAEIERKKKEATYEAEVHDTNELLSKIYTVMKENQENSNAKGNLFWSLKISICCYSR